MFRLEPAARALLDRTVVRRLEAPSRVRVVAVGGATFGGSGKTPLAIACAKELAAAGARVAFVGHAYRAHPGRARVVSPGDALDEVGDEALLAARALGHVPVVVAPSRQAAIAHAGRLADVLVLDGVAQLAPARASLALLAVDPGSPWGHGALAGPRAPRAALLEACDAIVTVGAGSPCAPDPGLLGLGRSVWPSRVDSRGVLCTAGDGIIREVVGTTKHRLGDGPAGGLWGQWAHGGTILTWPAVRALRVGLLTALARPERVVRSLAREGIAPRAVVGTRDHGAFSRLARHRVARAAREHGVDLWLATPKCALHAARDLPGLSLAVIEHVVSLHPSLRRRLLTLAALAPPASIGVGAP